MSKEKNEQIFLIGGRLREERKRLTESQETLSQKFSVSLRTWGKYERGQTMPDALTLSKLGTDLGADVSYILTGKRTPLRTLSQEDESIIKKYRSMSPTTQEHMKSIIDAFIKLKK